ncbi:hypothetical protein SLA_7123 [Streptomyces laurentii]|uniref:DUF317 domain-containing protein n=1 Tax=Streptomyces laurentii TaxID=39478 RepID=A0A160P7Q0_STRLU|nr:hypothetical protein SLA_7123 [Streptomyces laurentii]
MPYAPADAHIHFALHSDHHPGVIATATGPTADAARSHLHDLGFRSTSPTTMVLARIDREEPHYTARAAEQLQRYGFTTNIASDLQEEIDTEWEWGNYPFPWCTREEVREVSAEAQRIHDDIADGRLTIHFHADDGHTTVAVGSYPTGVRRHVHLHGDNHLRQVTTQFETETEAITEFQRLYSVAARPGPAPLTELETTVHRVLHADPAPEISPRCDITPDSPPVAGPGEHEEFLASFLNDNPQWEKYRTWSDETTIASHESLTVRAEFDHEARHRTDTAWTVAEYDGPVGERVWHATLTAGTPVALVHTLLQHLDAPTPAGGTEPYEPLRDAGWHPASHPARTTWRAPDRTMVFEHTPHATDDRWTLYGGTGLDRAAWAIRLSSGVSEGLLAELAATAVTLTPAPTAVAAPRTAPVPGLPPSVAQRHGRVR